MLTYLEIKKKNETIHKFRSTIVDLLEALNCPFPDSCDCGGSEMCAVCNAYRVLGELDEKEANYLSEEEMGGIRQDKLIREFANCMALDQVCPSGKDPSTQYEIGQVKILSDHGYNSIKKWQKKRNE